MSVRSHSHRENWILIGIFAGAVLANFWLVTRNWTVGFMAGHEFRQTQTALIAHYIDKNNDFSLLYEQPILGKPWISILMEVPIYEWSVVGLSRLTGWTHVVSARTISLACFYLTLPAVYLVLARFGLTRPRRLLVLSLILVCPVYIFYSRSFLMESMELMCCAWFLWAYLEMMDRRRWTWFLAVSVAGTAASLIKGSTFAVWLPAAAAYVVWILWRDVTEKRDGGAVAQTVFWGIAGITVPLGALRLWVELTDPIKEAHASAWIFTSKNLSQGNWGLVDIMARFSGKTWGILLERWSEAMMWPWLIGVALIGGLLAFPQQRARVAGVSALFFLAQLFFPFAYAYQEYYYYACALFLLVAIGFVLHGVLDSRLPRWAIWGLIAVVPAAQLYNYHRFYYYQQAVVSEGGFTFTEAIRELTPPGSVIVVAGADWAAIVPFYTQRRALMIRNGLQHDYDYLHRAYGELNDEDVAAFVVMWNQRSNTSLLNFTTSYFDFERVPTFSHEIADVYVHRRYSNQMKEGLKLRGYYSDGLKVESPLLPEGEKSEPFWVPRGLAESMMPNIAPSPIRGRFSFGLTQMLYEGQKTIMAHPDADLWLRAPAKAHRIEWDFGMVDDAWAKEGDKSDGVVLSVVGIIAGSDQREIFRRELDPVNRVADRGFQREVILFEPRPGEILHFSCRERGGRAYDWTYWARIEVK